jgi:hypothetical protein
MRFLEIFFGFVLVFTSCKTPNHEKIDSLLKSEKASDVVLANYLIGESHDSSYVSQLLSNVQDCRISHDLRFNGISVYQSKMIALMKISNLTPPHQISYTPDTVIIGFYKCWAIKNCLYKPR